MNPTNPISKSTPVIQLIRHGESQANAGLRSKSPGCIELTELGHAQARLLVEQFTEPPELIVVSPFVRTQQTAAPLMKRFPHVKVEEWPVHEFTYLHTRHYVNTTEHERSVPAHHYWQRCDPAWEDGGGAESFLGMMSRVEELERRLRERKERHVAVFTHGYFMKALLLRRTHLKRPVDAWLMAQFRDTRRENPIENTGMVPLT